MMVYTIKCQQCGREFYAFRTDRQFCDECRKARKREYGREHKKASRKATTKKPSEQVHVEATCPVCGKKFIKKKNSTLLYCSRKCAIDHFNKVNRNRRREKRQKEIESRPQFMHTCKVCGKIFYNRISNSARCPECIKAYKKYNGNERFNKGISRQPCILCGRKGNTLQTQVCIPCMDKLVKTWEKECSPGHRKCLVCGKDFVPNSVEWDADYHIYVAGQLTCSIQCTDELYAGVLDKKKRRAHTRGD